MNIIHKAMEPRSNSSGMAGQHAVFQRWNSCFANYVAQAEQRGVSVFELFKRDMAAKPPPQPSPGRGGSGQPRDTPKRVLLAVKHNPKAIVVVGAQQSQKDNDWRAMLRQADIGPRRRSCADLGTCQGAPACTCGGAA